MPQNNGQITNRIRLNEAVNKLSQYFGLYTAKDLAGRIALTEIQGIQTNASFDLPPPSPELSRIVELMIDTSTGGYTTRNLIRLLNQSMSQAQNSNSTGGTGGAGSGQSVEQRVNQLINVYYGPGDFTGDANDPNASGNTAVDESALVLRGSRNRSTDAIKDLLGDTNTINSNPNNPNRFTSPGLGVIFQNHIRATPAQKNVNACTIFLNSIPNIEIARAVPYLDIQFQFGRPPTDINNRLANASLEKFLQGAIIAPANNSSNTGTSTTSVTRLMLDANVVSGSDPNGDDRAFSTAGMELFTAPITLTNANEVDDPQLRSTPVLDRFRPFMTFKDLTVEVHPTTGIMCFKTAQMNFVLHDRSRLSEIADFIRPDLYSNTEVLLEYGWSHPDPAGARNYYADLINGMKCREKYGIVNTAFSMDEMGQVNLTLHLAMRGATDMNTENIASDESGVGPILRTLQTLSQTVGEFRRRNAEQGPPGSREVRGIQILDAASDATGQLILTSELRTALREFREATQRANTSNNPNVSNLLTALDNIYGGPHRSSTVNEQGLVGQLVSTVRTNIARKLARVANGNDPFKPVSVDRPGLRPTQRQSGRILVRPDTSPLPPGVVVGTVSLAKLFLIFIGEPLARTGKFDDVQLIFYPFNNYAGFANSMNIGQFMVDTRYFFQQYTRYRTENAGRAAAISLRDFLVFIATTVIDDPAASSYGLRDGAGAFYRNVQPQQGGGGNNNSSASTTEAVDNSVALQLRLERLLRGRTPDGTFRLPQIDFYIECIPESREAVTDGQSTSGSDAKSILRVHIFDRQTTSYDTQGALLQSNRDEELRTIGNLPVRNDGNLGVRQSQEETAQTVIAAARDAQLIEQIQGTSPAVYRISGGPRRLKDFLMKTSPYIIYGSAGTAVQASGLSTIQDSALNTVNLLRSFQGGPLEPNGENPGGLPLQVIPAEMSMQVIGCPLLEFAQQYFVDFQTGTTIDNYYTITGLSHKFEPGSFATSIKFSFSDAYGKYTSLVDRIRTASSILDDINTRNAQNQQATATGNSTNTRTGG